MNPKLEKGDRVVCYFMEGASKQVPPGTLGTVTKVTKVPFGMGYQYDIKWDNGSQLSLIPESDAWDYESENVLSDDSDNIDENTQKKRPINPIKEKLKNLLINENLSPKDFDDFILLFTKDEITDDFLMELNKKFLRSKNTISEVRNYFNRYVESIKIKKILGENIKPNRFNDKSIFETKIKGKSKLLFELNELDKLFSLDDIYSNLTPQDWDTIKEYLEQLRLTGIVNMFAAPPYLYAPLEWIKDQTKWKDLSDKAEQAMEKLEELHPEMQSIMINLAIKVAGEGAELSKINNVIGRLASKITSEMFRFW